MWKSGVVITDRRGNVAPSQRKKQLYDTLYIFNVIKDKQTDKLQFLYKATLFQRGLNEELSVLESMCIQ